MKLYGVVMAGGGGTRFWPLSRQDMPKQLLNLSGRDALINETIARIGKFIPQEDIYIVTNRRQHESLIEVTASSVKPDRILLEPSSRNTAACIGYAAFQIVKSYGDGVMCVFPSDHYIRDEGAFSVTLTDAARRASSTGKLITIGIKPTLPSTGYGYIKLLRASEAEYNGAFFHVDEFVEKPNYDKAKSFVESGDYLWNSGIFVWKASTILDNFRRFLPKVYNKLDEIFKYPDGSLSNEKFEELYSEIPNISIDYGIMERSDEVMVMPGDFGWNDVGSWDSLGAIYPADDQGNIVNGENIKLNTKNSIIHSTGRLIATIGLDNMIVVETKDTLLVCPKDKAQDVKQIVDLLKEQGKGHYL
ncbi:mannose-1-phosphate guanylyltransferase [Cohnella sp. OV330]|uniref:mannose-1-phosphate guanylyltransferase n=1 Tax=Cohnella sp. OV330 TaxID=1855288 RepID=UPI000B7F2259|nr:mannose-1-phosphate guanylyltransferase [Cohnella sp. OV330]